MLNNLHVSLYIAKDSISIYYYRVVPIELLNTRILYRNLLYIVRFVPSYKQVSCCTCFLRFL